MTDDDSPLNRLRRGNNGLLGADHDRRRRRRLGRLTGEEGGVRVLAQRVGVEVVVGRGQAGHLCNV